MIDVVDDQPGRCPPWPSFALVTVSGGALPAPWGERHPSLEVPNEAAIGGCRPMALRLLTAVDGSPLIGFGMLYTSEPLVVCLDPVRGRVVHLDVDSRGAAVGEPAMVNSSLQQYVATVRAATALFPYDNDSDDDLDLGAEALRNALEPIDPAAWSEGGWWDVIFYPDVTMGHYLRAEFSPPAPNTSATPG